MLEDIAFTRRRESERDALLARIEAALRADERVVAAWLAGSLGRGDADALSDLDLWIVVADDAIDAIGVSPRQFVAAIIEPCLVIDVPRNAPADGAYLFTHVPGDTGAHQVDWYWQAMTGAARPRATTLLFERLPIPRETAPSPLDHDSLVARLSAELAEFWAVVLLAAKAVARGNHRSVHRNLEYLDTFMRTMRWLLDHGVPPTFDDLRSTTLPPTLPITASEQHILLDRYLATMDELEPELRALGVALPEASTRQILRFVALVRAMAVSPPPDA